MLVIDYVEDGMYSLYEVDRETHEPLDTVEESDDLAHLIAIGNDMGEQVYLPETIDMMVNGAPEPPSEASPIVESVINEIMKTIVEKVMKDLESLDDGGYNDEEDETVG
tara:strand:+ start:200 stop:526 length:327 start_codon:yes stop_codon:yes gene_type:complete